MNNEWALLKLSMLFTRYIVIPAKEALVLSGLANKKVLMDPNHMSVNEMLLGLNDIEDYFGFPPYRYHEDD